MNESHSFEKPLRDWGKDSFVFWSKKPQGKAIVFIHGFGGSPDGTFSEFETRFNQFVEFNGYDVFFYGYDSLFQQSGISANEFMKFLEKIQKDAVKLYNETLHEKEKSRPVYGRVVIVAHSLGAVVSRRALLEAYRTSKNWVNHCRLILFAPAHKGTSASLSAIIDGGALPFLLSMLAAATKYFVPTLAELQGQSKVVKDLVKDTKVLISNGITSFTIALEVVWAKKERVVLAQSFCSDPAATVKKGKNHISVCKPNKKYMDPISIVRTHL